MGLPRDPTDGVHRTSGAFHRHLGREAPDCVCEDGAVARQRKREGSVSDGLGSGIAEVPHFHAITGHDPYPWQHRLYAALVHGAVPDAVDIPTGLGKTLCVLVLLLARLRNPTLPRRIVYVVDRRAIVDQTAEAIGVWIERIGALPRVARQFDACAAFPAERHVQLGVLRGGLGDDGAWRVDPARPAVVIGTVDMIGSRLLFSGCGDSRWARPMHAALLAHDAIVVLDEAHLSPAMGELLRAIEALQRRREFRTMTLSATVCNEDGTFRRQRSASFILPRSDRFALVQRCQNPWIEPVGHAFLPHTQHSTGCDRNSSTGMPSPPTSRRRVGRKAPAKAAMPGGVPRARPLLTSIAVTAPLARTTKSTSRLRSRQ